MLPYEMGTAMQERRQAARIDSLNLIHVTCHDAAGKAVRQGIGRTLNVSEKGILLEAHFEIHADEKQTLAIGLEEEIAEIQARVVHLQRGEEGKLLVGLSFGEMDEETLAKLKKFVQWFHEHHETPS